MKNKTALVTGASSGIGEAFARLLAKEGYNLVLVARGEEKLNQIKSELGEKHGIQIYVIAKDLSVFTAPQEILAELQTKNIEIDLLVNNAGFAEYGKFYELDLQKQINSINLNVVCLTALTHLFLPQMTAKKHGHILNVASTAAFQAGPLMAVYYATKAYVLSFSEGLNSELQGTGVNVTALCPGPTKTEFFKKQPGFAFSRLFQSSSFMSAERVAQIGYNALITNKPVVIAGLRNKILAFGTRLLPRSLVTAISKWTLATKK